MIFHVYANRSNAGDWLAARGIRKLLGEAEVTELLCDDPFVADTLRRLATAGPDDALIIGGGGLLMDYFDPLWEGLARLPHRPATYIWGIGVVDIKAGSSLPRRKPVVEVVRSSRLCFVRDELTRDFLDVPGMEAPVPCPSLVALDEPPTEPGVGLLHVANLTTVGETAYRRTRRAGMSWSRRSGEIFRETNNRLVRPTESELERIVGLYRMSSRVISSGLHGCVIANALSRPVVAVSGDRKIEAYMEMAGLADWVIQPEQTRELARLIPALETQGSARPFVERARSENAAVARRILRDLTSLSVAGAA